MNEVVARRSCLNKIRGELVSLNLVKKFSQTPAQTSLELTLPQKSQKATRVNNEETLDEVINQKCITEEGFDKLFETCEKLGEGAQSVVRKIIQRSTGNKYASKTIGNADAERIINIKHQYKLLKSLDLPTIIKAHYLFISQEESICRLVLELCEWRQLKAELEDCGRFSQELAAEVGKTLLETVDYLHSRGVCHRDIKPQNILYSLTQGALKLIDFEVSSSRRPGRQDMWTVTGSLFYKAPEMFAGSYDNKVDVWAVGIVVYELLHGKPPFVKEFVNDTISEICNVPVETYMREDLEPTTKEFLKACLNKDPKLRPTANQALKLRYVLQAVNKSVTPRQNLNCSFGSFDDQEELEELNDPSPSKKKSYYLSLLSPINKFTPDYKPKRRASAFLADYEVGIKYQPSFSRLPRSPRP